LSKKTVAVVTGANKGIGYEVVKGVAKGGLTVVLTARDVAKGKSALDALKAEGLDSVYFQELDVNSPESVQALASWLKSQFGGFDVLINNAGVNPTGLVDYEKAKLVIGTNYYGVKTVTEGLLPVLRPGGRIINTASRLGIYTVSNGVLT
jgi:carbonyl reductase 1